MKQCQKCNEDKDIGDFTVYRGKPTNTCKKCAYVITKKWRAKYPERQAALARKSNMKKRYGITHEKYTELFEAQNGVCKVCARVPTNRHLDVDHCHTTGSVRGLLCPSCNKALGLLGDDPVRVGSLLTYISENLR